MQRQSRGVTSSGISHSALGHFIFPCSALALPTAPLPAHPLWGQGDSVTDNSQQNFGNQGVTDKSATAYRQLCGVSVPLCQGPRKWLAIKWLGVFRPLRLRLSSASLVVPPADAECLCSRPTRRPLKSSPPLTSYLFFSPKVCRYRHIILLIRLII